MLGFVPGFAYLGRVDPAIAMPRRPRAARARAGRIGRHRRAADRRLSVREPGRLAADRPHAAGDVRSSTAPSPPCSRAGDRRALRAAAARRVDDPRRAGRGRDRDARLAVVQPGLLTTVQDLGRWGTRRSACRCRADGHVLASARQRAGRQRRRRRDARDHAARPRAARRGRRVVGDRRRGVRRHAATSARCRIGRVVRRAAPEQRLRFGERRRGARAYLAVAGGIADAAGARQPRDASASAGWAASTAARSTAGDRLPLASRRAASRAAQVARATDAADRRAAHCCACCPVRRTTGFDADALDALLSSASSAIVAAVGPHGLSGSRARRSPARAARRADLRRDAARRDPGARRRRSRSC